MGRGRGRTAYCSGTVTILVSCRRDRSCCASLRCVSFGVGVGVSVVSGVGARGIVHVGVGGARGGIVSVGVGGVGDGVGGGGGRGGVDVGGDIGV